MNQSPNKNYFTMPNEIFSLGLDASEIAVYAYLRCLENRSTYQCCGFRDISAGRAMPRSAMPLAAQRIRSCDMSTRSRRKVSSIPSRPLS